MTNDFRATPFSPPPATQGLSSATFSVPPLDGTLTILQCYDWHASKSSKHPLFVYAEEDHTTKTLYWPDVVHASHRAGRIIRDHVGSKSKKPVIAILSGTDMITYFACCLGIMRAGCTVFPISPRNSAPALAHLLSSARVDHVLLGSESVFSQLATAATSLMPQDSVPSTSLIPKFEDLYLSSDPCEPLPDPDVGPDDPVYILHSSGSTAFPKVITWTHFFMIKVAGIPALGEIDFAGLTLGCHSVPMFHGLGLTILLWAPACGFVISAFPPRSPAILPTPDRVIQGAMHTKSEIVFSVPSFIEAWLEYPAYVEYLAGIKGVLYGGGPLSKAVGDALTEKGVSIYTLYGSTETTVVNVILPRDRPGLDWQYFRFSKHVKPHLVENGFGQVEMVLVGNPLSVPMITNTTVQGVDAYATGDLLERHPTKPDLWKVFGRADDQIMQSTGEKTNPGPLEAILNQDPHVAAAVMFGRERFHAGVIVEPIQQERFDPDEAKLAEFRNKIWPSVERMNQFAPQHSRIFKEARIMILVASPKKPFVYSAKMTVRRQGVLAEYEVEIDSAYAALEESTQLEIQAPASWSDETAAIFLRSLVKNTLKQGISDEDNLFEHGCDSLQATWIRNTLLRALRQTTGLDTRSVSSSLVYQHPSIRALTSFVVTFARGAPSAASDTRTVVDAMTRLVDVHSCNLPASNPAHPRASEIHVVMLTGTTGNLGGEILLALLEDPSVERIYAFNRSGPGHKSLLERQEAVLQTHDLDPGAARSSKVTLLTVDWGRADFGLSSETLTEIRNSVTHVIHNAWNVHFGAGLPSFEANVRGLRNLIDLSLSSGAQLCFVSSIGVVSGAWEGVTEPIQETHVDASVALSNGYTQSKWVGERLLQIASEKSGLSAVTIRVGQLSGAKNGAWKTTEWLPALVKSCQQLGCMPSMQQNLAWLPLDIAARCIASMRKASPGVVHLVHPRPVPASSVFRAIANFLNLDTVPYDAWLSKLEGATDPSTTPALMLLDFFKKEWKEPRLSMERAYEQCDFLSDTTRIRDLGPEEAVKWIAFWKRVGFLSA
ncbi:acetyl-CoA synthetase-like protein [Punctularia strigosozonata HHB-11173 SS5]|uniref:acetyl-CoA synthetase-like protein n=1 Tax=Punctularia strigosozonata (strain HHB-11173) TaxID=741275 RepID=UPI00044164B1|nr:acetyl-CoA synthetase-like protein [Punctularia strigosozonata HHB-11173 SS5]EIN09204.1 acetyl-CoA synthetase-like protein [Punctularia strigosozonata HHB-11173 SS5]